MVKYTRMRNPEIEVLFVSAKTGDGIDELVEWVMKRIREWKEWSL